MNCNKELCSKNNWTIKNGFNLCVIYNKRFQCVAYEATQKHSLNTFYKNNS